MMIVLTYGICVHCVEPGRLRCTHPIPDDHVEHQKVLHESTVLYNRHCLGVRVRIPPKAGICRNTLGRRIASMEIPCVLGP